jgi:hypothetical protein
MDASLRGWRVVGLTAVQQDKPLNLRVIAFRAQGTGFREMPRFQ